MSTSKHKQRPFIWEAPPITPGPDHPFKAASGVASATECTGLEVRPVINETAAESYTDLFPIHQQKTQGNIGKGNPRNDPSEIQFHRE